MLFSKTTDNTSPLLKIHAHGIAADDMGSDLITTRDGIDHTVPIRECCIAYDGVVRPAFLFCKNDGYAWVVLACDKDGMTQAIQWMATKAMPFAGTIS